MSALKFVQYGLGPIGAQTASYLLDRGNIELEAAIDIDPEKVGKDVGSLIGLNNSIGVTVSGRADAILAGCQADIVVLSTLSSFAELEEQIMQCLRYCKNVISSCEEMAFPWEEDPQRAARLDAAAKAAGVTVLASGVNPGFAMDALPVFLTSVCQKVDEIFIGRHQDASIRRVPFQQKIGAGLSVEEFTSRVEDRAIRHVGFSQSVRMIAHAMGWSLERIEETVLPAIAEDDVASGYIKVPKGHAAGVLQKACGFMDGRPVITLELEAYVGHPAPSDFIQIKGEPSLYSEVAGGFNGDIATCAMIANSVPVVRRAEPGLKTMLDIGLTSWFSGYPLAK